MEQSERMKKVKAALGTTGVCVVVFLLMLLTSAWDTAGNGPGEYTGIEVNLGSDDQGSGNDQPDAPIGTPDATDDENPPNQQEEQTPHEEVKEAPVDEPIAKAVQPTTMTDPKSDVEINEVKKEVKPVEKPVEKKIVDKPVETKKPVEQPKVVNKDAMYQPKKTGTTGSPGDGDGKQGTTGNEGDDIGKNGDKGVAGGTPGANVYTGTPGGGHGSNLQISGWQWDATPDPKIPNNESGRIEFIIKVNAQGEITDIVKDKSTVSLEAEQACRREIEKLSFSKTGTKVPESSTGRITFIIRSK